jgi:large subunit ribosomal protein L25
MEEITLSVDVRAEKGTKKELSELRQKSRIPAVVYGASKPPVKVALSEKELMSARRKGGVNAILHLKIGQDAETVIVKELQRHPVTDRPVHADFQRISLTQKIEAKVPLRIVGEAPGVKVSGGVMQHELRDITVKALPTRIPQHLDVDVSHLEINQSLLVKDLRVDTDLEILDNPERLVVHVTQVKIEVAETPAAAAVPAEGAAATAEPELASTKGKKDEEGKPLPKEAKMAPGAEKEKGKEPAKKEGK